MECAKALKVNAGTEPEVDLGPVISKQVRTISKVFAHHRRTILATSEVFNCLYFP